MLVEYASADGSWVSLCQAPIDGHDGELGVNFEARSGVSSQPLERYLIAPGEELAIDALLTSDRLGRFAVVLRHGVVVLWDSLSRTSADLSELGVDPGLSLESFANPRLLAFDNTSEHLLYVKRAAQATRLVVRTLSDGYERELDAGPGIIWRASFDPSGLFVIVQMRNEGASPGARLEQQRLVSRAPRPCSGEAARFHAYAEPRFAFETLLIPVSGGTKQRAPGLIMTLASGRVRRDESGALLLEHGDKQRLLEPSACKGRLVHADASRELFIIGCMQKKHTGRVNLELVTGTERKPLGIELAQVDLDRELADSPRLLALYPGAETVLFDADRQEVVSMQAGDRVVMTRASRALLRRQNSLLIYDADTRSEQALPFAVDKYPVLLVAPPFAFVSPLLVNLDTSAVVGVSEQRPLALSNDGRLLLADVEPNGLQLARGPLCWRTPRR